MIEVIRKLFSRYRGVEIPAEQHRIRDRDISEHAYDIVERLQQHGFVAYIVGGAVRDILLGCHPTDFDVTTDASLQQVRRLFRRSRIIGKRYPIVHVYKGGKMNDFIEVSTFSGEDEKKTGKTGKAVDLHYQDANRRDFTVNGIFYNPINKTIYDYVGGAKDIAEKKLRIIKPAKIHLPEDPVRILRALRLSTKLGLYISSKLEKELMHYAPLLVNTSSGRLADEIQKVLTSGAGARILQQWQQFGICEHILPALKEENSLFFSVLAESDRRYTEGRPLSFSYIFAALFWPQIASHWHALRAENISPMQAMEQAIAEIPFKENYIVTQRYMASAKDLYFLQAQMENTPTPKRAHNIINKKMFDRALAFAAIRQDSGAAQTASWWSQFVQGGQEERDLMLQNAPRNKRKRRQRKDKTTTPPPA
ncbi:MAG: CCA tRNA nucleotidyltransferase [Proteobacteria bacterium]|nr:CCA tRNA nucleotidyltransferase [Pseudomonadota bacterium]